jgi:glycosyltransferase involved in cell wall biosynthesis
MTTPTLSVVMGNYNHAHYLVESIPAILNQSFRPKEFIIIDDGSTDNSVEIIEGFAKKDPVVRFYKNDKNLGNAATYIKAYELITGDYLNIAAADDLVLPGLFEKTMAMLAKYPNAGVCSAITRMISENGDELKAAPEPPYVSKTPCYLSPEKVLKYFMKGEGWCVGNTAIWRQSAIIESGGFPWEAGLYIDEFLAALISLNHGACFIPERLALHRVLPGSVGSKYREDPGAITERIDPITTLMRTSYKNKFPEPYIKGYQRIKLYEQASMALQKWQESMIECNTFLDTAIKDSSFLDKWLLKGNEILGGIHHRFLKLYLYARLRKFSWLMIHRVLLRLMEKFKAKQE